MVLSKDELGKLVKEARKIKSKKLGKRYTQVMLANDINKSQGYIGDIESGRTYPTFRVLSKIAETCEVPFSFFGNSEKDTLYKIIKVEYPNMNDDDVKKFSDYIISMLKNDESSPFIDINKDLDLNFLYSTYSEFRENEKIHISNDDNCNDYTDYIVAEDTNEYITINRSKILDAKAAMDLILNQPGLMLNGEMLSDESKIAIANAIQMGLAYAEQIQGKKK